MDISWGSVLKASINLEICVLSVYLMERISCLTHEGAFDQSVDVAE